MLFCRPSGLLFKYYNFIILNIMQYELKIMPLHGQYKKLFLLMKHVDGITCGSSMLHAVSCIQFTVLCYGLIFFNFFSTLSAHARPAFYCPSACCTCFVKLFNQDSPGRSAFPQSLSFLLFSASAGLSARLVCAPSQWNWVQRWKDNKVRFKS